MAKRKPASLDLISTQAIYCGDNLDKLRTFPDACIDLIYIDPPFNSNRNYEVFWGETKEKRAFEDRHESTRAYIDFMRPRCVELARVLKKTGSFYYHCDWHASHYVKVMLDQIFGENEFQSEIIWKRTSAHSNATKNYAAVHDVIFFCSNGDAPTWNRVYQPYDPEYVAEHFVHKDPDGRLFRRVDLVNPAYRPNLVYEYKGYKPHPNGWKVTKEKMEQLDREGRLFFPKKGTAGRIRRKLYLDESLGAPVTDVWTDIKPIHASAAERLGYPTQKPLVLLERIVQASSNPGDIVLDAFCGCGTALVAAEKLDRRWIGIDVSPTACRVMAKRLKDDCKLREGKDFFVRDLPRSEKQLREMPHFEFENWAVIALGGIPNKAQVGDMGIDGKIYPVSAVTKKTGRQSGDFDFIDIWYPIQVKQKDKAGRPDIDSFEAMMTRENRTKGFFVLFDYTSDARAEIDAFFRREHRVIIPLTVREILDEELAMKLA